MIKRFLSVLLAAIMAFTIVAGTVSSVSATNTKKPFTVKVNGKVIYEGKYVKKYARNDTYNFTTK